MSKEDLIKQLKNLSEKIRTNNASLQDYEDFEKLLINSGYFEKEDIERHLKTANLTSYKELVDERIRIQNEVEKQNYAILKQRKLIEGIAVVGIVALGLAAAYNLLRDRD